jgi:carbonic anhydrase
MFDAEKFPRAIQTTYRYPGSLTTPPCSEGVQWLLMSETVELPQSDIDAFRNLHFFNARYTQPINGRTITLDSSVAE